MVKQLGEIFDPRSIKLDFNGKTKETVLTELVDSIAAFHPECGKAELFDAVMAREKKMSTGIGNGIAIPHVFYGGITGMDGALGVIKQGIDYGALDDKPVHVIFLLVINRQAEEYHLRILNLISKLTESGEIALIRTAKSVEEIHAILCRIH